MNTWIYAILLVALAVIGFLVSRALNIWYARRRAEIDETIKKIDEAERICAELETLLQKHAKSSGEIERS